MSRQHASENKTRANCVNFKCHSTFVIQKRSRQLAKSSWQNSSCVIRYSSFVIRKVGNRQKAVGKNSSFVIRHSSFVKLAIDKSQLAKKCRSLFILHSFPIAIGIVICKP